MRITRTKRHRHRAVNTPGEVTPQAHIVLKEDKGREVSSRSAEAIKYEATDITR